MSCKDGNQWTVEIVDNGSTLMEAQPLSLNLTISRNEYDFCRAKFPWTVGEMMKPHTRNGDGKLYSLLRANILLNGKVVQPMLFRPDWVTYTEEQTHVDLHDLRKALEVSEVDIEYKKASLKNVYSKVVNSVPNRIIDTLNFDTEAEIDRTIYTEDSVGYNPTEAGLESNPDSINPALIPDFLRPEPSPDKVFGTISKIDFNEITALKALHKLNKKFGFTSWVNTKGELVVGVPEMNGQKHIAAPDDRRVWRYKDPQISHSRDPVKTVLVYGSWADASGVENDPRDWFGEQGDARAVGKATRTDIEEGKTISKETGAAKDSLQEIAKLTLLEETKDLHSGTISLDPETSGSEVSEVASARPGDKIRIVPSDEAANSEKDVDCRSVVNNDIYDVYEVTHNITDGGAWEASLDISIQPDIEIETDLRYYDPKEGDVTELFNSSQNGRGLATIFGIEQT